MGYILELLHLLSIIELTDQVDELLSILLITTFPFIQFQDKLNTMINFVCLLLYLEVDSVEIYRFYR